MTETKLSVVEKQKLYLDSLGYINVGNPIVNKLGKRVWTFTHADCNTAQSMVYGNITAAVKKDPNNLPCSCCGGRRRAANATNAFVVACQTKKDNG